MEATAPPAKVAAIASTPGGRSSSLDGAPSAVAGAMAGAVSGAMSGAVSSAAQTSASTLREASASRTPRERSSSRRRWSSR